MHTDTTTTEPDADTMDTPLEGWELDAGGSLPPADAEPGEAGTADGDAPAESGPTDEEKAAAKREAVLKRVKQMREIGLSMGKVAHKLALLKAETKEVKEEYDTLAVQLQRLAVDDDSVGPLFEKGDAPTDSNGETMAWREELIEELAGYDSITPNLIEKLIEAGIETLGDLADRTREKGDFWARDIKGVGALAAEKIGNAAARHAIDHRELYPPLRAEVEPTEPTVENGIRKVGLA